MKESLETFKALNMSARIKFMRNACNGNINAYGPNITRKQVMVKLIEKRNIAGFFSFDATPEGFHYWADLLF